MSEFVEINVEEGSGIDEGVCLRFKRTAAPSREVFNLLYESESGQDGTWSALAVDASGATAPAHGYLVEDSSDGVVWLIAGGNAGLLLTHAETGETERVAYLVLDRNVVL